MKKILIYLFSALFLFNTFNIYTFAKEIDEKVIVIDPGHQGKGNNEKEPIAPNSSVLKAKVTTGTTGKFSKVPESEVVLDISLILKDILEKKGYTVVLTRETQDINISNAERAKIANDLNADAFIRIHADGSLDESVEGVSTLCQTKDNPNNGALYDKSYLLSKNLTESVCEKTNAKNRGVKETDTMSGINWAKVPVSIIEVGFLSNKKEDMLLQTDDYRKKIAEGIADGLDKYFNTETIPEKSLSTNVKKDYFKNEKYAKTKEKFLNDTLKIKPLILHFTTKNN